MTDLGMVSRCLTHAHAPAACMQAAWQAPLQIPPAQEQVFQAGTAVLRCSSALYSSSLWVAQADALSLHLRAPRDSQLSSAPACKGCVLIAF